jgi:hypothetical protein
VNSRRTRDRTTVPRVRWPWAIVTGAVVLAAGIGAYALAGTVASRSAASPRQHESTVSKDTYTTAAGTAVSLASLRGRPIMVWFVVDGCASCSSSLPAVAAHFDQLTETGLRILTLGLFGAFASGAKGVSQLLSFGRASLGASVERRGWQWGMASRSLSLALDPSGTPDLYVLISSTGRITYRNSVPVSTMNQLLAAARRLDTAVDHPASLQLQLQLCCP